MDGENGSFHHEIEIVKTNKTENSDKLKLIDNEQKEIWFLENNENNEIEISKENFSEDSADHDEVKAKSKESHEDYIRIQEQKLDFAVVHSLPSAISKLRNEPNIIWRPWCLLSTNITRDNWQR